MSADPNVMRMMLASQLMQGPSQQTVGGMQGQISPMGGASNLLQKIMLMRYLQGKNPQQAGTPINPNGVGGMQGPVPLPQPPPDANTP
jgi:hypothetical protein